MYLTKQNVLIAACLIFVTILLSQCAYKGLIAVPFLLLAAAFLTLSIREFWGILEQIFGLNTRTHAPKPKSSRNAESTTKSTDLTSILEKIKETHQRRE